jgi:hypothetical protein
VPIDHATALARSWLQNPENPATVAPSGLYRKLSLTEDATMPPDDGLAADIQAAEALLLESTVEMYRERGHPLPEARKLAETLINSPAKHRLPEFDDL